MRKLTANESNINLLIEIFPILSSHFIFCANCKWHTAEAYDRRDKPSVLVTSPSSPDRVASGASAASGRYQSRLTPSGPVPSAEPTIGGRIQIKLGFEPGTLQLILTVICATGLSYRANGATRNPYSKVNTHTHALALDLTNAKINL